MGDYGELFAQTVKVVAVFVLILVVVLVVSAFGFGAFVGGLGVFLGGQ